MGNGMNNFWTVEKMADEIWRALTLCGAGDAVTLASESSSTIQINGAITGRVSAKEYRAGRYAWKFEAVRRTRAWGSLWTAVAYGADGNEIAWAVVREVTGGGDSAPEARPVEAEKHIPLYCY
jgi:hypothetical protein